MSKNNNLTFSDILGALLLLLGYTLFITGFNELVEKNFITFGSTDMMLIGGIILFLVFIGFNRLPNAFLSRRN